VNVSPTDRELLEAAAKAAGLMVKSDRMSTWLMDDDGSPVRRWNPLADDGDALRLAVRLRLEIDIQHTGIAVRTANGVKVVIYAEEQPDPYAATCIAIVRAAASMGGSNE
jgi:hypothetical protein